MEKKQDSHEKEINKLAVDFQRDANKNESKGSEKKCQEKEEVQDDNCIKEVSKDEKQENVENTEKQLLNNLIFFQTAERQTNGTSTSVLSDNLTFSDKNNNMNNTSHDTNEKLDNVTSNSTSGNTCTKFPDTSSSNDEMGNTFDSEEKLIKEDGLEVEKENKRSLSAVVQALSTVTEILNSRHTDDLNFIWNSVKPDKNEGKHIVSIEIVVKENFCSILKHCLKELKLLNLEQIEGFSNWVSVKNILNISWLIADSIKSFCRMILSDSEILQNLYCIFKSFVSFEKFEENKNLKACIKAFLGILHNICRHCSDAKENLRNYPYLSVLLRLSKTEIAMIRAKCLIVMSYIVNDSEIHVINTDAQVLVFIVDILKDAKGMESHMSYKFGMNVEEILQGLNNLLTNDENKEKLLHLRIIEVYLDLIHQNFNKEEVYLVVLGIWKLSFHRNNKEKMKACNQLILELKRLQDTQIENLKHAVRGALWEIDQHVESPESAVGGQKEANCPHIMISYQWDSQSIMLKVKDRLKDAGYKVWMDVEHMTGSTLEAMALAVEKSAVILIGMTQKYKDSPACRSEAEYLYKLRKSFIPLRLQHRYVPDGWLGMLIGTRLYFDISSEEKVDQQMKYLMKELGNRGKPDKDAVDGRERQLTRGYTIKKIVYEDWSREEVTAWLKGNGFDQIPQPILGSLDGPLLKELVSIQEKAPEYFYKLIQTDFGFKVIEVLRFSKLLRELNS